MTDNQQQTPVHAPNTVFDRHLLARRRDRWAKTAEQHDFLLERVADDFAARLAFINRQFARALILEAAHGVVGERIAKLGAVDWFASADPSLNLLMQCAGPKCVADVEWLPFGTASLDLILSPLTLHTVNDLPGALIQARRALKNDGLFMGAMLGGETLFELRHAWLTAEARIKNGASPRVAPFADIRDLGGLLQRAGFALPVVDSDRFTVTYASPIDLMRDLRAMAASNGLHARSRTPVTKSLLAEVSHAYQTKFADAETGRIPATFEILTMTAWAPDQGQQKPLKPGTAQHRLADALGTSERSFSNRDD